MRAVVLDGKGEADILRVSDGVADPEPHGEEVRVRIRAFGINRADVLQRKGFYPAPPDALAPKIPGMEFAGEIDALGPRARQWKIGDRVCGITSSGAYAELVCVHERTAIRIPEKMSFEHAAAIPEAFMTAWDALDQGRFEAGGSVLIHAAGSGVGTAAVQLVAAAGGASIGTSRTADKLARLKEYGLTASELLDGPWDELAKKQTAGAGVDIVLDFIGVSTFAKNLSAIRTTGRIVQIGTLGGVKGEVNLGLMLAKRATLIATTLRARPVEEKIALARTFERLVMPQFAAGRLRAVVDKTFDFKDIAETHRHMESDKTFGKITVRV
ncbi:MAG: NAD(P)H-quinone oxidoreductase [Vulcanimicrobiaceae bacterium]